MNQNPALVGKSSSSNSLKPLKSLSKDLIPTQSSTYNNRVQIVWTMPKARRFHTHESLTKDIPLINPGSGLSKCSTSLGYGKRYTYHPVDTPASSLTHRDLSGSLKKILKNGRSQLNLRLSPTKSNHIPGPGSYSIFKIDENKRIGVLIKSRIEVKDSRRNYPGPGFYTPGEDPIFINRFKDIRFGSSRRSEFTENEKNRSPGPASYKLESSIDKKLKSLKMKNKLNTEKMKIEHRVLRS